MRYLVPLVVPLPLFAWNRHSQGVTKALPHGILNKLKIKLIGMGFDMGALEKMRDLEGGRTNPKRARPPGNPLPEPFRKNPKTVTSEVPPFAKK